MQRILSFISEARSELIKVNWPTKERTIQYSLAVLVISIAVAVFLGALDYGFGEALDRFVL
ncbi:MAG: preprotein translocase subunit SecE [Candidatus Moranbacteria bacterium]|nr:preprotein translocase subunit SecE [Candidatus Moranbacteria bacterium]